MPSATWWRIPTSPSYAPTSDILKNWMRYYGVEGLDGLLADLGVSSSSFRRRDPRILLPLRLSSRHAHEQESRKDCCRHRERIRGRGTCRHLLSLRRAEEFPPHRLSAGQGKSRKPHQDHQGLHGCRGTPLQARAGEEGDGQALPGTAHRGESRRWMP